MEIESTKLVYTVEEAGKRLGLSRPSAFLAVRRGAIPFIRVGRRILIPKAALEKFLENAGSQSVAK